MSFFADYSPVPAFPKYSGPYKVGTVDVEIPVTELNQSGPAPNAEISTVSFRIFYPCEPNAKPATIRWLPEPQRGYMSAFAKFMGLQSFVSDLVSLFPQIQYYITIPAAPCAQLLNPTTESQRWPVMIFSHGLGGTRTAYSHIVGSLASHGIVVIAPEHRDGSATVSYLRDTEGKQTTRIDYKLMSHEPGPEVYAARDEQLKVRMWELFCIYDALLRLDAGKAPTNLAPNEGDAESALSMLADRLDIHTPGAVSFAGHSFGAVTVTQFVKSVFWRPSSTVEDYSPLVTISPSSPIAQQVTASTPLMLLDIWGLPLRSPATKWLWEKPLPCYTAPSKSSPVLSILSEQFFKWRDNVTNAIALLAPPDDYNEKETDNANRPRIFYPASSAHLSQSDFGVLFPWLTKAVFKADEPERCLRLNVRAMLQVLREQGIAVADTSSLDREEEEVQEKLEHCKGDSQILELSHGIRGWVAMAVDEINLEEDTDAQKQKKTSIQKIVGGEVLKDSV